MRYVLYAERFGWTPAEVDALPAPIEPWLLPVSDLIAEVRNERRRGPSSPSG